MLSLVQFVETYFHFAQLSPTLGEKRGVIEWGEPQKLYYLPFYGLTSCGQHFTEIEKVLDRTRWELLPSRESRLQLIHLPKSIWEAVSYTIQRRERKTT